MLFPVIDIGSTGVRLSVAQSNSDGLKIIDESDNDLPLAEDVFSTSLISIATQSKLLEILSRYKEQLRAYSIEPSDVSVIATSAFREAGNKDPVMDMILGATGFRVEPISGSKENRLMYIAVTNVLKSADLLPTKKRGNCVILEVGGGSTGIMVTIDGKMASAHSFALGAIRLQSKLQSTFQDISSYQSMVDEYAFDIKSALTAMTDVNIDRFIAVGPEAVLAASTIGKLVKGSEKGDLSSGLWEMSAQGFDKFIGECTALSSTEVSAKFGVDGRDSVLLQNSLLIYKTFMHLTKVKTILATNTNIRMGLILDEVIPRTQDIKAQFDEQTISQSISLLQKYHGDEFHAQKVREYSTKLFDAVVTQSDEDVDGADMARSRLLLEVAAILHDIGIFISMDRHNLHSQYIIRNSEIFGINPNENIILGLIAKYHRGKSAPQSEGAFTLLSRHDRLLILRLTAILRVADALDRCHGKSFDDFTIEKTTTSLTLHPRATCAIVLESEALHEKGDLFENVFGLRLTLV